ncbi:MAG: alpha/beta hydrolase [bacterium]|nr:alpha/beta hydrolase [bacterium]
MKQSIVVIPAWTLNEGFYKKLIKSAPSDTKVLVAPLELVVPDGNPQLFEENFLHFLKRNNLEKANLIGHSLGGVLALAFASHHPEKVNKLYLIDTKGVDYRENIWQALSKQFQDWFNHTNKKIGMGLGFPGRFLRRPIFHSKLGFYAKNANLEKEAKAINVPTVLIWGEKDRVTPLNQGRALQHLISNSKMFILEGMDHNWLVHSPKYFWQHFCS